MKNKTVIIAFSILMCFMPMLASVFVMPPGDWYNALIKPPLTPPGWVFAPVWTMLYLMLSAVLYRVIQSGMENKKTLILLFFAQLFLNALWSPVFFGMHMVFMALCTVIAMLVLCIVFLYKAKFERVLSLLMMPYMLWLCFATYLTAGVYFLN